MTSRPYTIEPLAGNGWLWAGPAVAVYTPGTDDPRLSELGRLVAGCDSGWEVMARVLLAGHESSLDRWPSFAVGVTLPDGLGVVARGVDVFADPAGPRQPGVASFVAFTAPPGVVVRFDGGAREPSGASGDLVEGTVRAGGVAFVPLSTDSRHSLLADATGSLESYPSASAKATGSSHAGSTPPPPASVLGVSPARPPGPPSQRVRSEERRQPVSVDGVSCGRGHFNDPRARYCRVCGLGMHQTSRVLVKGPRPPLGVLVWDNGSADQLETDMVIGRTPDSDPRVASGEADGLVPAGNIASLSRVHAEIRLVGWEVTLADRDSSNGTFVWEPDQATWRQLAGGEAIVLKEGMSVGFAERLAVFETGLSEV